MSDGLDHVRAALVAMPDAALAALQAEADESPQFFAPNLFAFLSHAVDWELGRRQGHAFLLNGPRAAIPPEELGASFATLAIMMVTFGESTAGNLLGAVGEALKADPPALH